ncbi:DUF4376 domain-containing protein [uncultured Sphingomonas sp.]|uniref:DUF4376 domain-containing protein n=1 Tax=uncultured Sphingomonas sp. TaxID=158754 RepID=UPI0025EAB237|nr:DUF4376 domain-containing protein [uncultured Sphingomonas sp.]
MKILLEKTMQNGAQASEHTIETLTITDGQAVATVTSRTSAGQLAWQEPCEIDPADLTGDPIASAAASLMKGGGYLEGGVIEADQTPLEVRKLTSLKRVDQLREIKVTGGCPTEHGIVQTDDVSIRNILGSVQTASLSAKLETPFSIEWRMADNSVVTLDANEMIAMGVAVMSHIKTCYTRSWALKDAVEACQDEVSLAALVLTLD